MLDTLPSDILTVIFKHIPNSHRIPLAERLLECQSRALVDFIQMPDTLKVIFNKRGMHWDRINKHPLHNRCIQNSATRLFKIVYNSDPVPMLKGQLIVTAAHNDRPDIMKWLDSNYNVSKTEYDFINYLLTSRPIVSAGAINLYRHGFKATFTFRNRRELLPTSLVRYLRNVLKIPSTQDITLYLAAYTGRIALVKEIIDGLESSGQQVPKFFHECALLAQDTWTYATLIRSYSQLSVDTSIFDRMFFVSRFCVNPYGWDHMTILYVFRMVMDRMTFEDHLELFEKMCRHQAGISEYTSSLNWYMPFIRQEDQTLMKMSGLALKYGREDLLEFLIVHHGAQVDMSVITQYDWFTDKWEDDNVSDFLLDLLCESSVIIGLLQSCFIQRLIWWYEDGYHCRIAALFKYPFVASYVKYYMAFYSSFLDSSNPTSLYRPSSVMYNMLLDSLSRS